MYVHHLPGFGARALRWRTSRLAALPILLCAASAAGAQQPGPGGPDGSQWGLGLGVVNGQKAYTGIDRETKVLPMIRFENEYVKVAGLGLEVKLPGIALGESSRLHFGLVGRYDFSGYEDDDAPILAGMAERKSGFWVGARAEWETDLLQLSAEWTADASGHSKGQRFSLGVEKPWRFGDHLMLVPHVTAHWHDKKYVGYYYGVTAAEATAGRAAYEGKAGVNVDVGLRTMYMFDRSHSMLLDVAVTSLAKGIEESPLVDRSSTNRVILGYMYRF